MTIQTEPDYGEPQFDRSEERIGDWSVTIQTTTYGDWLWTAYRKDGAVRWNLESQVNGLATYDEAKAQCVSVLESLTPDGFTPQRYVSIEDANNKVQRLENGRWFCVRGDDIGEHDFATASLAAAAHEVEAYT